MSIIISHPYNKTQKIDKSEFAKEGYLQEYIHLNPESIPVYEIEEDKKLFVVAREYVTGSGRIDALAIDKDGDIYVIETKLFKNPDKRTVVAQALDYGASLWRHTDFSELKSRIDSEIKSKFKLSFEEKVMEFFEIDMDEINNIIEAIKNNLQAGNIKFVILMDKIDERLKDLIVFINQSSQFDIYAVQMEYYKFEKYEIMIPKLFGVEVRKNVVSHSVSSRRKWDEENFIRQVKEKLKKPDADKVIGLYNSLNISAGRIKWGTGNMNGSYMPIIDKLWDSISPFTIYSDGEIQVKFKWFEKRLEKDIVDKFYNVFANEVKSKTEIILPKERYFKISSDEFLKNHKGLSSAIINTVKG
jgi:hypothetical protein